MIGRSLAALMEALEPRTLLSAGSWAGSWYFNGFSTDATRYDSGATFEAGPISRSATVSDLPGDQCLLTVSGSAETFTLTNNGDSLMGRFTGVLHGANKEEYFCVQLISPGLAVMMEANAGFDPMNPASLSWGSGVAGILTRSKLSVLARPWEGTYDVQTWEYEARSNQAAGTLTPSTAVCTVSRLSTTTYQAVRQDAPAEAAVLTASGNTLLRQYTEPQVGGDVFEGRSVIMRSTGDWFVMAEGGASFSGDRRDIHYTAQSISIVRPQPSSEYKPDLRPVVGPLPGSGTLIPGETIKVPVTIYNDGNSPAVGRIVIDLYTSSDGVLDRSSDILAGTLTQSLNLPAGASKTVYVSVPVPADAPAGSVQVIADVDPQGVFTELHEDNNQPSSGPAAVSWQFGTIAGRAKPANLVLEDADGSLATFSIKGGGTGEVTLQDGRWDLNLTGTGSSSVVSVKVRGGDNLIQLGNVTAGSIKSFSGSGVVLNGDWLSTGTISSIVVNGISGGHGIEVLGAGVPLSMTAGTVADTQLRSASPIKSISVVNWLESAPGRSGISAPSLSSIRATGNKAGIAGDLQLDMALAGSAQGATLGSVSAAGRIGPGTWDVEGSAGKLAVGSVDASWAANFTGPLTGLAAKGDIGGKLSARSIGTIAGGSMSGAQIAAGADLGSDAKTGGTNDAADLFGPGWIGKLSVTGAVSASSILAGVHPFDGSFNDINDVTLGGRASYIKSVSIGGTMDAESRIDGGLLPAVAKIAGVKVGTELDSRFGQNKYAIADAGTTDANGDVTLNIAGQPQVFEFLDEATLSPIAGAGVAVAVDALSLSFGVMTIVSPGRTIPVQIVTMGGSAQPAGGAAGGAAGGLSVMAQDNKVPVFLGDVTTKATQDILTDKLVDRTFYQVAQADREIVKSKVGALASGFTSLVSLGLHCLDNVSHGAVSDYLSTLPVATNEMMTPQQAKDHVIQARKDELKSTLVLAGMQRKLDPLAPYSLAIDLAGDYAAWGVADMAQDLPGMGVRVTNIMGMEIYSFVPIPPWERAQASGLVNVQVPTAADAQNGFLELISKSDLGTGYVVPLDSQGNANVPVELGDYAGVVHAAGFDAQQMPITVTAGGVNLNVTLHARPVPGFTVTPISGLVTGENGASDSFTVSLKVQPTANVTLELTSSDTGEGDVWPSSLTFTPDNWNAPQTVTVSGVNDLLSDGDIQYSIDFAPAASSDARYNGLTPSSVAATNRDNEISATVNITSSQVTNLGYGEFMITVNGTASGPVGAHLRIRGNMFATSDWQLTTSWTLADSFNNEAIRQDGDPADTTFTCSFRFYADAPYTYDGADAWLTVNGGLIASDSTGPLQCG